MSDLTSKTVEELWERAFSVNASSYPYAAEIKRRFEEAQQSNAEVAAKALKEIFDFCQGRCDHLIECAERAGEGDDGFNYLTREVEARLIKLKIAEYRAKVKP